MIRLINILLVPVAFIHREELLEHRYIVFDIVLLSPILLIFHLVVNRQDMIGVWLNNHGLKRLMSL